MSDPRFDLLTIGNAIVDILARIEDDILVEENVTKGMMRLVDAEQSASLYGRIGPAIEASGGSAGNTAAGAASLGLRTAYIGKVADDHFGQIFRHDIQAQGVAYETAPLVGGAPTATSIILISPDGERTMNTHLGACVTLAPEDIVEETVAASAVTYVEGYLWDPPLAKDACRRAFEIAHANGRKTAITLSDSFCVDRYREEFLDLMRTGLVDIVFANESELKALYQTSARLAALDQLRKDCAMGVVTLGEEGALVVEGGNMARGVAYPVEKVEDLTGAGDQFAAGFIAGLVRGQPLHVAAKLGCLAASEVIGHVGPRPAVSLKDLANQHGIDI